MIKVLRLAILLVAFPASLRADAGPHWFKVKTAHFTVYTDGSDRQAKQVSAQFERMHGLFAKLLPHATDDASSGIVVLALKSRRDFQSVEPPEYLGKNALDLAGYFLPRPDRSFIALRLDTEGEHPYRVIYHEYTHYMLRHVEALPVWLNEGLAQFYQNTDLDDKTARFGQPAANEILFLRQQHLIPLATLFAVDHNSPFYHEQDKGNVFYAESWALTHMLFLRDFENHTNHLSDYVTAVSAGADPVHAAESKFGDLRQLQKDMEQYVDGGNYKLLSMPLQNSVSEASLTSQAVPTADADAVRADLLIEDGRKDEGQHLLQAVLQAAPENAEAHESMGMLALRDGQQQAARKWFGEAAALHSDSFLTYYYFGVLSLQLDGTGAGSVANDAAGASLLKATELNPRFAPAWDALAQFDARHEQLEEASQMELRAVGLEPKEVSYRLNAAEIRIQRRQYDTAVTILQSALGVAQAPADRERIQSRLNSMERMLAQEKSEQERLNHIGDREIATAENRTAVTPTTVSAHANGEAPPTGPVTDAQGHALRSVVHMVEAPKLPSGLPRGPLRTVRGAIENVGCFYPKGLVLSVKSGERFVPLYAEDMYSIRFTASNFTPKKELNPCEGFAGLKAGVTYSEISGQAVAGQIVSVELTR